ncbi:MAG: C45 family peptidase [Alphaproteobacteria bacterium]
METIVARGDAFAVGQAIGRRGGQAVRDAVFQSAQFQALKPWLGSDRLSSLKAATAREFPRYLRELEGIAHGAGLALDEIFLWNCRGDLRDLDASLDDTGCTTVLVPGETAIIGHNEDGGADLAGLCFLSQVEPEDGPKFTAFSYPGMLPGHAFGVNQFGLVQTINNIRPHDLTVGVPRHVISRAVLDCRTLDEALEILRRNDRAAGFHHALAQAGDPRLLSVEAPASGCTVIEAQSPMAHANHLVADDYEALAQDCQPSSDARQERADALIAAGTLAGGNALDILFDRANAALPILRDGDEEGNDGYTLATAVFKIGAEAVDWSVCHGPDASPVASGTT